METKDIPLLRDETALRWSFLEDERDACVVVSERMELIYVNTAARGLMPDGWFGKRCFEVLPVAGETCAFHCPKIRAVNEAAEIVYCEESVCAGGNDCAVFGVGLIPLGPGGQETRSSRPRVASQGRRPRREPVQGTATRPRGERPETDRRVDSGRVLTLPYVR